MELLKYILDKLETYTDLPKFTIVNVGVVCQFPKYVCTFDNGTVVSFACADGDVFLDNIDEGICVANRVAELIHELYLKDQINKEGTQT